MKPTTGRREWFVAVADGHGANGHFVSQFIANNMPKQFEQDKKAAERTKKSKDISGQFKNNPNDSHYSSKEATNREMDSASTLFKNIHKATCSTFLTV